MPTATKSRYLVLIPAYKPDERLVTLVETLIARGLHVLVVDDGGQEKFLHIFTRCEQAGAAVTRHAVNMGKGRALKTGLNEILLRYPDVLGVVTADADGQHTPDDIERVIAAMAEHPRAQCDYPRRVSPGERHPRTRHADGPSRPSRRFPVRDGAHRRRTL